MSAKRKVFDQYRNREIEVERGTDEWRMSDGWCCYSCPVCGIGVCGPIDGPIVAHKSCYDSLAEKEAA